MIAYAVEKKAIAAADDLPFAVREMLKERKGRAAAESYAAYGLFYRLLRENGYPPFPLAFTDRGAPYLVLPEGAPRLFLSVAHTEALCAAALSDRPIGIDVEETLPLREKAEALAARFFSARDAARVTAAATAEETNGVFLTLWTQMEAEGKQKGCGISPLFGKDLPSEDHFLTELSSVDEISYTVSVCEG